MVLKTLIKIENCTNTCYTSRTDTLLLSKSLVPILIQTESPTLTKRSSQHPSIRKWSSLWLDPYPETLFSINSIVLVWIFRDVRARKPEAGQGGAQELRETRQTGNPISSSGSFSPKRKQAQAGKTGGKLNLLLFSQESPWGRFASCAWRW